jgi:hypothetical protein
VRFSRISGHKHQQLYQFVAALTAVRELGCVLEVQHKHQQLYQFVAALTAVRELGCVLEVQRFQKLPRNTRKRMPLLFPRQVARRDQVVPVRGAVPNLQSIV